MILIMQQTLAGTLGIPFRDFESFDKGLLRYKLNISKNEQEKEEILDEMQDRTAIHISLSKSEVDKFRPRTQRRYSDADKFKYSAQMGDPLIQRLAFEVEPKTTSDDFSVPLSPILRAKPTKRALSADEIRNPDYKPNTNKNLLQKAGGFLFVMSSILWDNKFFESIFPLIKQQKPGKDLYVWQFLA